MSTQVFQKNSGMNTAISCSVLVQTASVPKEINVPNGLWRTAGSNTAVSLKFPKGKLGAVFRAKKANRGINTLARAIIALVKEVRLH